MDVSIRQVVLGIVLLALALALAAPVASTRAAEEAPAAIPCEGDECQGPAPAPEDPTPATAVVVGPQNPPVHFPKPRPHRKPRHKKHGPRRTQR